jgi:beta-catenin-like protein 1
VAQELHSIAAMRSAYAIVDELGTIKTLIGLLSHENTDIAIAVINLLQVCSYDFHINNVNI